jgi:hypothetical protein
MIRRMSDEAANPRDGGQEADPARSEQGREPVAGGPASSSQPSDREAATSADGGGGGDGSSEASAGQAEGGAGASSEQGSEGGDGPRRRRRRRRRRRDGSGAEAPAAAAGTDEDAGPPSPASDGSGSDAGEPGDRPVGSAGSGPSPKRRKPKKPKNAPRPDRSGAPERKRRRDQEAHHALRAVRAISEMAAHLLEIEGVEVFARPRWMEVKLRVPLDADRDGKKAANAVTEQILERVRQVREHERALLPGSVYSFYHERADAEGCRPEEPRQVFDGYSSTGRPQWADFVTLAIDRKDEGIDELLEGEDVVVTHVTIGRVLRTQQLVEFGKKSPVYRLLGQVDAGLFPVLRSGGKAAFSFQLLRGTTLEGKPRLRLHPVGAVELTDLADPSVAQILYRFQQRLDAESLRLAGLEANGGHAPAEAADADGGPDEEFVVPLLTELARQLSGRARRKRRRTDHADQRSGEGQRPTTKAFSDAKHAGDEAILCDDVQDTVVVVGPKNRVHVFTHDARHVTSLVMQSPAIRGRRAQGRWRAADPDERGTFRIGLSQRLGEIDAADSDVPAGD